MRRVKVHYIPPLPSLHTTAESLETPAVSPPLMLAQRPEESELSPLPCVPSWSDQGAGKPSLTPSYGCAADWTQRELPSEHDYIRTISLIMSLCHASFPVMVQRFYMHPGYYFCQPIQELKIWKPGYLREVNLLHILNLSSAVVLSSTF